VEKELQIANQLSIVQRAIDENEDDKKIMIQQRNKMIKELKQLGWSAIRIAKHLDKTRDFVYKSIDSVEGK
tara:strand:- start:2399 stop:2611 length:213 start_codon:yes stop_codon:yes gene_type:complete